MIISIRHVPHRFLPNAVGPCSSCERTCDVSSKPPARTPRPGLVEYSTAGLLTCGSQLGQPSRTILKPSGCLASLNAYSCGGSYGLGSDKPCTVFPFHPSGVPSGTVSLGVPDIIARVNIKIAICPRNIQPLDPAKHRPHRMEFPKHHTDRHNLSSSIHLALQYLAQNVRQNW